MTKLQSEYLDALEMVKACASVLVQLSTEDPDLRKNLVTCRVTELRALKHALEKVNEIEDSQESLPQAPHEQVQ